MQPGQEAINAESTRLNDEPRAQAVTGWRTPDWVIWTGALVGPAVLTVVLVQVGGTEKRNYVFLYLGLMAIAGVLGGLWPALLSAVVSFALGAWHEVSLGWLRRLLGRGPSRPARLTAIS